MPSIDLSLPEEIHGVAFDTYAAWSEGSKKLSEKDVEAIGARLLGLSADLQELWNAVASLGALAITFEAEGDPEAAETVRELIGKQAAHFRPVMEELESEAGEGQKASAAAFNQMFGGGAPSRSAPRHDEAAPEGSVSLKSLLPNPALGGPPGRGGRAAQKSEGAAGPPGGTSPKPRAPRGRRISTEPIARPSPAPREKPPERPEEPAAASSERGAGESAPAASGEPPASPRGASGGPARPTPRGAPRGRPAPRGGRERIDLGRPSGPAPRARPRGRGPRGSGGR